jgi:hypothetical protein
LVKFDTLSKSSKMVNLYNAILLADKMAKAKKEKKEEK